MNNLETLNSIGEYFEDMSVLSIGTRKITMRLTCNDNKHYCSILNYTPESIDEARVRLIKKSLL